MTIEQDTTTAHAARIRGTFTLDAWDQQDGDPQDGLTISRAAVRKTFSGDLVGTSRTEILMALTTAGPRSYCGYEQVTGTVAGRTGTVVLRHAAEGGAGAEWMTWTVLPGSGTGGLAGVTGEGQIERAEDGTHSYWLDLSFG